MTDLTSFPIPVFRKFLLTTYLASPLCVSLQRVIWEVCLAGIAHYCGLCLQLLSPGTFARTVRLFQFCAFSLELCQVVYQRSACVLYYWSKPCCGLCIRPTWLYVAKLLWNGRVAPHIVVICRTNVLLRSESKFLEWYIAEDILDRS